MPCRGAVHVALPRRAQSSGPRESTRATGFDGCSHWGEHATPSALGRHAQFLLPIGGVNGFVRIAGRYGMQTFIRCSRRLTEYLRSVTTGYHQNGGRMSMIYQLSSPIGMEADRLQLARVAACRSRRRAGLPGCPTGPLRVRCVPP